MCIYLIRHAQTVANLKDEIQGQLPGEISELGWKQAQELGKRFQNTHLDAIITSDLRRAVQTASCVARYHNITPQKEPLLREQHLGIYQGRPTQEAVSGGQQESELFIEPPEGESIADLLRRAKKFWTLYAPEFDGKTTMIVSHGVFLNILLLVIFDKPMPDEPPKALGNASVTMIQKNSTSQYNAVVLNDTSHLEALLGVQRQPEVGQLGG